MDKKNAQPAEAELSARDTAILDDLLESIKGDLLAGKSVRLLDFANDRRPFALAAIATLRDELPIRCGWQTMRESHLSETRLRARRNSIDGAYLHSLGDDMEGAR